MTVQTCRATTRGPAFVLALALAAGAVSSGCDSAASRQLAGPSAAVTATVAKVTVTPTSASVAAA